MLIRTLTVTLSIVKVCVFENDGQLKSNCYVPRNNWILLDVFYEDINFQLYEQTEAISLSALISE